MSVPSNAGIRGRMRNHRDEIQKLRKYLETNTFPPQKNVMWVYQRLAHEDIDKVDYGILSILPFLHGNNLYAIHFHCLLALAEAAKVIYLGTQVDHHLPVAFTGLASLNWTPHELIIFTEVFKHHENDVTYDPILDKPRKDSLEAPTNLSLSNAQYNSLADGEHFDFAEYEANEEEMSEVDAESLSED
ncbi:hypothetical protein AJ80_05031 [Polytolypa hystricis UAMH7299]|uniref:Uncharacterized protein n=1 Tax=Polytolypa hystricis (strain UAMH7299) TaxID=1447883 RepID=A0A2B7Y8E7_POLH7|nr:hypothetical protein AJ80_05031 [Polytolypa hystricis UAMH7299]